VFARPDRFSTNNTNELALFRLEVFKLKSYKETCRKRKMHPMSWRRKCCSHIVTNGKRYCYRQKNFWAI